MNTETQEFDDKNFILIQNELIKILSKTPNTYIEQSHLYEKLISAGDFGRYGNEFMKYKNIIVLKYLPAVCENIFIKYENNIFSGIFSKNRELAKDSNNKKVNTKEHDEYKLPKKDFIDLELPEKITSTTLEIDSENNKLSIDKKLSDDTSFPTETQVIQFIVDNDIKSFLFRKDYQGNTILHSLIIDCDATRIENLLKTCFYSFIEKNNAGKTPLDLITDIKVSNVVHTILYQDLEYYSYKVSNMRILFEKIDVLFKYTLFSIVLIDIILLILIIYF
jgi:hypothetical protein